MDYVCHHSPDLEAMIGRYFNSWIIRILGSKKDFAIDSQKPLY